MQPPEIKAFFFPIFSFAKQFYFSSKLKYLKYTTKTLFTRDVVMGNSVQAKQQPFPALLAAWAIYQNEDITVYHFIINTLLICQEAGFYQPA